MRMYWLFIILISAVLLVSLPVPRKAHADNLGSYTASLTSPAWVAINASRSKPPVVSEFDYAYGDENAVTFNLPWMFPFYGQQYNQITADTNGNIWFTSFGPLYNFDLASTTRGPVISAWHDDLSSYASGGVFIQRKTLPEECIVIEWQTETYTEEGYGQPNDFQVVLYPNGTILMNYKSFTTSFGNDNGSGISKGDGTDYTSIGTSVLHIRLPGNQFNSLMPPSQPPIPSTSTLPVQEAAPLRAHRQAFPAILAAAANSRGANW